MSGTGARRATGWPWLSCNDRPAPPVCIARLADKVAAGDLDPAEASALEEAVRSMRERYGVAASPTIDFPRDRAA